MTTPISLGFSPCPNDTFIFDALVNKKIDTEGLEFTIEMHDVQTLNEMAIDRKIDCTKISYGSLPLLLDDYIILNSGSALGKGVGPLLISKQAIPKPAVNQCTIAIPGKNTTAHVLFSLAFPEATNKVFLKYDEIEDYVNSSKGSLDNIRSMQLGVIIHENRFTYQEKGLVKIMDLGDFWEEETGFPVPLGGIVIKREIPIIIQQKIERLIKKSLAYAYNSENELSEFVKQHAQEMSEDVMRQHINLYVNDFSIDLGKEGREAIKKFMQIHSSINKIIIDAKTFFL